MGEKTLLLESLTNKNKKKLQKNLSCFAALPNKATHA